MNIEIHRYKTLIKFMLTLIKIKHILKKIEDTDFEFDGTTQDLRDMLNQVLKEIEKRKLNKRMKILIILIIAVIVITFSVILLLELL